MGLSSTPLPKALQTHMEQDQLPSSSRLGEVAWTPFLSDPGEHTPPRGMDFSHATWRPPEPSSCRGTGSVQMRHQWPLSHQLPTCGPRVCLLCGAAPGSRGPKKKLLESGRSLKGQCPCSKPGCWGQRLQADSWLGEIIPHRATELLHLPGTGAQWPHPDLSPPELPLEPSGAQSLS